MEDISQFQAFNSQLAKDICQIDEHNSQLHINDFLVITIIAKIKIIIVNL